MELLNCYGCVIQFQSDIENNLIHTIDMNLHGSLLPKLIIHVSRKHCKN